MEVFFSYELWDSSDNLVKAPEPDNKKNIHELKKEISKPERDPMTSQGPPSHS